LDQVFAYAIRNGIRVVRRQSRTVDYVVLELRMGAKVIHRRQQAALLPREFRHPTLRRRKDRHAIRRRHAVLNKSLRRRPNPQDVTGWSAEIFEVDRNEPCRTGTARRDRGRGGISCRRRPSAGLCHLWGTAARFHHEAGHRPRRALIEQTKIRLFQPCYSNSLPVADYNSYRDQVGVGPNSERDVRTAADTNAVRLLRK